MIRSLEEALDQGGSDAVYALLFDNFRKEGHYHQCFELRLFQIREQLGLPLIPVHSPEPELLEPEVRRRYEEGYRKAAREAGQLFLSDGKIEKAWIYFRAVGDSAPVREALENFEGEGGAEVADPLIRIAFQEGVHPRKGIELILQSYGLCRAITAFHQYPGQEGRQECIRLLVEGLYGELMESLKRCIERQEGREPPESGLRGLVKGRGWLFEGNAYHVDISHLASVVKFSLEGEDPQTQDRALELAEYGRQLAPLFQPKDHPPFEQGFVDYWTYLRALRGQGVEEALLYFRNKLAALNLSEVGSYPAQVLVDLLCRLRRYQEALEVSRCYLREVREEELFCLSLSQLCQLAEDYETLAETGKERGDLLSFAAGRIQARRLH